MFHSYMRFRNLYIVLSIGCIFYYDVLELYWKDHAYSIDTLDQVTMSPGIERNAELIVGV